MGSMGLTQGRCFPVLPRYSRRLISVFSAFRLRWDLREKEGVRCRESPDPKGGDLRRLGKGTRRIFCLGKAGAN